MAVAGRIQGSDPHWVAPLKLERKSQWSTRSPFFEHAQAQAFIARRDDVPVGVISAQVDARKPLADGHRVGWFGQMEAIDDEFVFQALMTAAYGWLSKQGCARLQGPYDLSVNQGCGLLIEGRDTPPMVMMNHAPAYYATQLERLGFAKAMDLFAYRINPDFQAPAAMERLTQRLQSRLTLRPMDFSRFSEEVSLLRNIFNDAWSQNWGFVPLSEAEFQAMGKELRLVIQPDYTCVAEMDGQPAGFIIALPNVNELIADLQGRLLPFGWARLLWRIKRNKATSARVPLMGVRKAFQRGPMGAAISFAMIDRIRRPLHRNGVRQVEMSWILETNQGMNSMIESMCGDLYKRYRLYERDLPATEGADS
ncbi:MAG: N-acetyltransferase [Pseudomonadota bacterium]